MTHLAPSAEQNAFIAQVVLAAQASMAGHGGSSLVLQARAGTGKTTTIKMAMEALRAAFAGGKAPKVLYLVFNKKNQVEAQEKLGGLATCLTLNSFGSRAVVRAARTTLDGQACYGILNEVESGLAKKDHLDSEGRANMVKLLSLSRQLMVEGREGLVNTALDFGLGPDDEEKFQRFIDIAARCMRLLANEERCIIDFDDQVWLPVYHDLRVDQYDIVFVDESQDLSPAKLALALKAVRKGGVFAAVGDDRQAIYGFAGADPDSLPRIIRETGASVLPLTVTRRCPKAVVAVARQYVGDYTAHEEAPEGHVSSVAAGKLPSMLQPGDTVVSRTNAPLVALCLSLLAAGTSAKVLGRADVAEGLKKLISKAKTDDLGDALHWVSDWAEREIVKLSKAGRKEATIEAVQDKVACLEALSTGCDSVAALLARIDRLFTDAEEGRLVLLTSTHKAKGLEWDRVYVLADTYRANKSADIQEENLLYVAITRAKKELVLVTG